MKLSRYENFAVILILRFFWAKFISRHFNFAIRAKIWISWHFNVAVQRKNKIKITCMSQNSVFLVYRDNKLRRCLGENF